MTTFLIFIFSSSIKIVHIACGFCRIERRFTIRTRPQSAQSKRPAGQAYHCDLDMSRNVRCSRNSNYYSNLSIRRMPKHFDTLENIDLEVVEETSGEVVRVEVQN